MRDPLSYFPSACDPTKCKLSDYYASKFCEDLSKEHNDPLLIAKQSDILNYEETIRIPDDSTKVELDS